MTGFGFLSTRFRGFRVVNLLGLTVLLVIAVGSYAFKTLAVAQDAGTAGVEDQILREHKRIRMLKAEIAHLETPRRLRDLSSQYLGLGPVDSKHDIALRSLAMIAAAPPPVARPAPQPSTTSTPGAAR